MPEAMEVTTTGSTRTMAVLSRGRNPCFDVLLLAEHVALRSAPPAYQKGSKLRCCSATSGRYQGKASPKPRSRPVRCRSQRPGKCGA